MRCTAHWSKAQSKRVSPNNNFHMKALTIVYQSFEDGGVSSIAISLAADSVGADKDEGWMIVGGGRMGGSLGSGRVGKANQRKLLPQKWRAGKVN